MPDFEVAMPQGPTYPSYKGHIVNFQSGRLISNYSKSPADECIGERITSLKQLIMIPRAELVGTLAASTNALWAVLPWWYMNNIATTGTPPAAFGSGLFSMAANIAQAYAFVRGSTDVHIYPGAQGSGPIVQMRLSWLPGNSFTAANGGNNPGKMSSVNVARLTNSGGTVAVHGRMPAYQKYVRISPDSIPYTVNWKPGLTLNTTSYPVWTPSENTHDQSMIVSVTSSPSSNTIMQSRSAGDDASCGFFMGPPALALLGPTPTSGAQYDPDASLLS